MSYLHYSDTIYKNGRFEIVKSFDKKENDKSLTAEYELTYSGKIQEADLITIKSILESKFSNCKDFGGCDGVGWGIANYANKTPEVFKGYIYGNPALEELVDILYSLQS